MTQHDNTQNPTPWMKASASDGNGSCVQMRRNGAHVEVRDSKLGEASPILQFTQAELVAFMDGVDKREFNTLLD